MCHVKEDIFRSLELLLRATGPGIEVQPIGAKEVLLGVEGGAKIRFELRLWEPGMEGEEDERVLWILRRTSPVDLERLRKAGSSFVALNGVVRIQAPGLIIDRGDLPRVSAAGQAPARTAFSDRASLVPRTLFTFGLEREWTVSELAAAAGVSDSMASYAVRDLEERGLLDTRQAGRRKCVRMPSRLALIEEWCREYRWRDNLQTTVLADVGSPEKYLRRLPRALGGRRWAATLYGGAALTARHAPVERVHVYVETQSRFELLEAGREEGWSPGEDGLLVLMAPKYKRSLWQGVREIEGVPVVSLLQLILDLWHHPLRGREQARVLLESLEREVEHGR